MQPAVPEPRARRARGSWRAQQGPDDTSPGTGWSADDVGEFAQGSRFSRWALARYLVGRVILDRVSTSLAMLAGALVAVAVLIGALTHLTSLAVLVAVVAVIVLVMRLVLRAVLGRLLSPAVFGASRDRVDAIVKDARRDVLAELRRVGLPGRAVTLPLLAVRLAGRRRRETVQRFRAFDVDRAVPPARRDELHMIVENVVGHGSAPGGRP